MRVSAAITDALLAVTVTSKPSVIVEYTVGGTEPQYVTRPTQVAISEVPLVDTVDVDLVVEFVLEVAVNLPDELVDEVVETVVIVLELV